MSAASSPGVRERLAAALPDAMRARDRVAVSALRSALARVANAEAVHIDTLPRAGSVHDAAVGAGAADAPRRMLAEGEVRAIVEAEVAEHDDAARHLSDAGQPDAAARARARADVLRTHLDGS